MAAALAYGVASPAAPYARYDFAQPLAGLALALTVLWLLEARASSSPSVLRQAGTSLGVAVLTRPEMILLAPWIAGWLAVRARPLGSRAVVARAATFLGPVVAGSLLYLSINWIKFGSPARTGYGGELAPVAREHAAQGMAGLLSSPEHGLLVFFPLAWLGLPGVWKLIKDARQAGSLIIGSSVSTSSCTASSRTCGRAGVGARGSSSPCSHSSRLRQQPGRPAWPEGDLRGWRCLPPSRALASSQASPES